MEAVTVETPAIWDRDDLGESYPDETFSLFSNHDLVQLLTDVCVELGRRDESISVVVA